MNNTLKEMLSSSSGHLSSKRVMGVSSFVTVLGCIVYLVITEGGTVIVENLLQTVLFMSSSLLGIESITNIWKGPKAMPPNKEKINETP